MGLPALGPIRAFANYGDNPFDLRLHARHLPRVFRAIRFLLTIACAIYLSGSHWMLLQVSAWTAMVIERTSEQGLGPAVESTLSGRQPCHRCVAIQQSRTEEHEKQDQWTGAAELKGATFLAVAVAQAPMPRETARATWVQRDLAHQPRSDAPASPPPRRA